MKGKQSDANIKFEQRYCNQKRGPFHCLGEYRSHRGRIVEAEVKAVVEKTNGPVADFFWKRDRAGLFVAGS